MEAASLPTGCGKSYHDRGRAHLALENFEDAIADFDESDRRRRKPLEDNDFFRQIALCSIAIRNNPYDASAHLGAGQGLHRRQGI